MTRFLLCASLYVSATALGQGRPISPTDCDDNFAECKEDCAIQWGGNTNMKMRAKMVPCMNKCVATERDCRETFFETKRNNLDEGSIAGSPSSRDVDSDGLPTKTAQKKPPVEKKEDDLRDDGRRPEPKPEPVAETKKKEPESKPAELRPEEVPKSNRSQISKVDGERKAEPKVEPAPPPKKDEPPSRREDPPVRRDEPKKEEAPPPPPPKKEKKEEPKKEEKRRALDEWDPDAF